MLPTQTLDNEGQIQVVAKVSVMDPALLALFNAGMADNAAVKDTVVALEAETEGHRDVVVAARNDTEQMRDEVQSLTDTTTGLAAAASDSAALASSKASAASASAAAALTSEQEAEAAEAVAIAQAGSATASAEASAISAAESRTSRLAAEVAEQAAEDALAATNTARTATETARDATLASETRTHTAKNTAEAQATIATTQAGIATNQATNADLARQAAEAARTRAVAAETTAVNKAAEATNRADEAAADAVQTDLDRTAVTVMKEETSLLVVNAQAAKQGAEIAQASAESSAQTAVTAAQNAATSAGSAASSAQFAGDKALVVLNAETEVLAAKASVDASVGTAASLADAVAADKATVEGLASAVATDRTAVADDRAYVEGVVSDIETMGGNTVAAASAAQSSASTANDDALAAAASAVLAADHADAAALSASNANTDATAAVEAKDRAVQAETTVVNNIDAATQAAQSTAADLIAVSGHRTHVDAVVDQFDIDAAAAIQAAETARQGAEAAAATIPANAITEAPADGKQYVRQDAAWEEVTIPAQGVEEAPADGKQYVRKDTNWAEVVIPDQGVDASQVPIRHDFVFTGIYNDVVTGVTGYLVSGVLDPIDFPGDIATTSYFGSLPTMEGNASFLFKRRVFNSPDVGPGGLGLYTDDGETVSATSEVVGAFTTANGEPGSWMLPLYNAQYTSTPITYGLPGVVNPGQVVKQSIHYMIEKSTGYQYMTRTRTIYRETANDPWVIWMDWDGEYYDPAPAMADPDLSWEVLPYASLPTSAPADTSVFQQNTSNKTKIVRYTRLEDSGTGTNYFARYYVGFSDPSTVTNFNTDPNWIVRDIPQVDADGYTVQFEAPPGAWYYAHRASSTLSSKMGAYPKQNTAGIFYNGNASLYAWFNTFSSANSILTAREALRLFPRYAPSQGGTALNTVHSDPNSSVFSVVRATILPGGSLAVQNKGSGSDLITYASADNTTSTSKEVTLTIPLRSNVSPGDIYFAADAAYVTIISHERY